ncbi:hypothetical protein EM308_11885 [Flavobacterium gilvum]|uniref:Uncharacterized protein n=1 Tax=Flavobacterium gilvum TaxID=1492737 RepID=A0AAC9I672_9FLAO|nr:hypothetical protein [Flavobacterium gilvum]AOW10146.1 hypothetical protein EM308_11885 [Flavobacterium gilvum]KFC58614.1 hypothetical protein FEM08_26080 [Flavobacterium gilvum]
MVIFVIKGNRKLYDIQTIKNVLKVPKSKVQRLLNKQDAEIVKYKNLHLYPERTLFNLMELILIEKLDRIDD